MKVFAALTVLFAVANAEYYVFKLKKINPALTVDMTCIFNKTDVNNQNLEVSKYTNFVHGNTYSHYIFDCHDIDNGVKCSANVNETACETGYEGDFCGYYGGYDDVVKCHYKK